MVSDAALERVSRCALEARVWPELLRRGRDGGAALYEYVHPSTHVSCWWPAGAVAEAAGGPAGGQYGLRSVAEVQETEQQLSIT